MANPLPMPGQATQQALVYAVPAPNGIFVFRGQNFVTASATPASGEPITPPPPSFTATGLEIEISPY